MSTSSLQDLTSNILKRNPGFSEIEAILELLPNAGVLIHRGKHEILSSNSKASEISAYTKQELVDKPIGELFPVLQAEVFNTAIINRITEWETLLCQRNGSKIKVQANYFSLGAQSPWGVLQASPRNEIIQKEIEEEIKTQQMKALLMLSESAMQADLPSIIKEILRAGQLLTGASLLAIYQSDLKRKIMRRAYECGNAYELPEQLQEGEISHLRIPYVWAPGKRAVSELHRAALSARISYLATIPIDINAPSDLILVVADQIADPPADLEGFLEILAGSLRATQYYQAVLTQIKSELRQQTNALNINETIKEIVNDGILFVSETMEVLDINPRAELTLGYQAEEVKGKSLEDILISSEDLIRSIKEKSAVNDLADLGVMKLRRRTGESLSAHLRTHHFPINEKEFQIAIVITDLSKDEEYKARAQQLEQRAMLGEITAIFAHEVRNPINNISTGLQVMALNMPPDDPMQEQIHQLRQDCDRLAHLMKSVLSFSGSREYKMAPIKLNTMLEGILARWQPRLLEYGIELKKNMLKESPILDGDIRSLEQVFNNIIRNAVDVMNGKGGILGIKVQPNTKTWGLNQIEISISDTGPGIPEDKLQMIFEPFYTTNPNGNGFGLAIVRQILKAHDGDIKVESFPVGSVFKVILPIKTKN